jgi:heme oxygenase
MWVKTSKITGSCLSLDSGYLILLMPLTQNGASLAQQLKSQTQIQHQDTEEVMLQMLAGLNSKAGYAKLLGMLYGFYFPLEQRIETMLSDELMSQLGPRSRAHLILNDLTAIDANDSDMEMCKALPFLESPEEALGAMYVLEGSALGGKMISRMLLQKELLGLQPSQVQFFNGYGPDTGKKWNGFLEVVNRTETNTHQMVQAASNTFVSFRKWIQQHAGIHE